MKKSIAELPEEEAMSVILNTRKSRLERKTKKKKKKQVKNPDMYIQAYASSLTDSDLAKYIKKLEEKKQ